MISRDAGARREDAPAGRVDGAKHAVDPQQVSAADVRTRSL